MKNLMIALVAVLAFGASANENCIDQRAAFLAPCANEGERYVFDRGQCEKPYEFVSVSCQQPEGEITLLGNAQVMPSMIESNEIYMTNVELVRVDPVFTQREVETFLDSGDVVFYFSNIKHRNVKTCEMAEVTLKVGRGNMAPLLDGREIYTSPDMVSFKCLSESDTQDKGWFLE